jgi:nicotinamidase-related amidase
MKSIIRILPVLLFLLACQAGMAQRTALLLIDIQEFYFPGGFLELEEPEAAGKNAGLILERFRQEGMPVIHVRHNVNSGGGIHKSVEPRKGEVLISKDHANAFLDTPLQDILQADSIEQLVVCGMQTHMCVEAAVRAASDLGYKCWVVDDACATRTLQHGNATIPATQVHHSTLASLVGAYATVIQVEQLLSDFQTLEEQHED